MKKKIMASLLVGSALVSASLAPLSAQAVTTGNTPVQVEFGGGVLPDHDNTGNGNNVDPDPTKPNTDFDLLAVPKLLNFLPVKIGEDLSAINLDAASIIAPSVMVGDVRGTKEGWHVTGEIGQMNNGSDKLTGEINFTPKLYYAVYNPPAGYYTENLPKDDIAEDPTAPSLVGTSIKIGGGATILMNAPSGKGQGTWSSRLRNVSMNVTTPIQELKKGSYEGNITWNLVAGPSI
ncbi:WxL domain-containing protein [Enterococcus faecalis]|nr:WxL domain-containing protein [Enterococcus faecalis]